MKRRAPLFSLTVLGFTLAAGCSLLSPRPDPTKYYVLTPIAAADSTPPARPATPNLAIGLGPVQFPDYLARLEVVTRASSNRIELSPTDRWAEPLDESFRSVLAGNLTRLLGTGRVIPFPWYASVKLNYKIEVTVERFERDSSGGTQLAASWLIRDGVSDKLLASRQSNFNQSAVAPIDSSGSSMDRTAAALSVDLSGLSHQIAATIIELDTARPNRATDSQTGVLANPVTRGAAD